MKAEVRMCDVCLKEVDLSWPLNLTANAESSPTEEFLNVDFCSVGCLMEFAGRVKVARQDT